MIVIKIDQWPDTGVTGGEVSDRARKGLGSSTTPHPKLYHAIYDKPISKCPKLAKPYQQVGVRGMWSCTTFCQKHGCYYIANMFSASLTLK